MRHPGRANAGNCLQQKNERSYSNRADQIICTRRGAAVTFTVIQPLTIVGTSDAVSSITTLSNGDYLITYTPFNNDPAIQDEIVAREFDPTGQIVSTAILTQFHGFDTSTPYASG